MKKPMTTEELFHKILDILKDKGRLPEILDYGLADGNPVPITTYEFKLRSNLNYGGSEGIYGLSILTKGKNASMVSVHSRRYMKMKKPCTGWPGSFCTLSICIFSEFAISHKIGLIEQNENSIVPQTSERTDGRASGGVCGGRTCLRQWESG